MLDEEPPAAPDKSGPKRRRTRPLKEIKADLDAIEAEFERLHGRPLLDDADRAAASGG